MWVTTIQRQLDASSVWVLGHSEGGLVALIAAQQMEEICGLVLVSTAVRPLGQVIRRQLESNPENQPYLANAMWILESLESGKTVDATQIDPVLLPLFMSQARRFLISELTIDPASLVARYNRPVLIVQGSRDIQVSVEDAQLLKQANARAELTLIQDVNHVLKVVLNDDLNENFATYSNPNLPLADGIVDTMRHLRKNGFTMLANSRPTSRLAREYNADRNSGAHVRWAPPCIAWNIRFLPVSKDSDASRAVDRSSRRK